MPKLSTDTQRALLLLHFQPTAADLVGRALDVQSYTSGGIMLGQRGGIGGGRNGGRVKSRRTVAAQVGGPALLPQSSIASNCVTASAALIVVTESQKAQMGEKNQKPSAHGDRHGRGVVVVGNPASEHHHDARRAQLRTVEISAATEAEVLGLGYARSSFLRTRRGAGLSCWT